jgi:iron(III) transport system permease protein
VRLQRYQTITGKDFKARRIDLGAWRYLTCGLSLLLVFLITGLPFIIMLYASLMPRFQPPTRAFRDVTFVNYRNLLADWNYSVRPLWNSTLLGVICFGGDAVGRCHQLFRQQEPYSRPQNSRLFGFAPIALPSVVLGTAFLWFYLLVPLPVIGSLRSSVSPTYPIHALCVAFCLDIDGADSY